MPVSEPREVVVECDVAASQLGQRGDVLVEGAPALESLGGDGLGNGVRAHIGCHVAAGDSAERRGRRKVGQLAADPGHLARDAAQHGPLLRRRRRTASPRRRPAARRGTHRPASASGTAAATRSSRAGWKRRRVRARLPLRRRRAARRSTARPTRPTGPPSARSSPRDRSPRASGRRHRRAWRSRATATGSRPARPWRPAAWPDAPGNCARPRSWSAPAARRAAGPRCPTPRSNRPAGRSSPRRGPPGDRGSSVRRPRTNCSGVGRIWACWPAPRWRHRGSRSAPSARALRRRGRVVRSCRRRRPRRRWRPSSRRRSRAPPRPWRRCRRRTTSSPPAPRSAGRRWPRRAEAPPTTRRPTRPPGCGRGVRRRRPPVTGRFQRAEVPRHWQHQCPRWSRRCRDRTEAQAACRRLSPAGHLVTQS